jgi:metal-responsive CopG/Arc/MetJ family transcriptional regulator
MVIHWRSMRRATITIPDDLEAEVERFLAEQEPEPSLTALVQTALRRYLDEAGWTRRKFAPPTGPLSITSAAGSGERDTSEEHDRVLAESR